MKVLGNQAIVKDEDIKYPFGANIQNETDVLDGTPVVREIYGDVLMNIYKLLSSTKTSPTDTEDNDETQYQLIDALKKFANGYNDIEQVLTLTSSQWSVPFDLDILPNKYVFFARPTDNYVSGTVYTFVGIGGTTYNLTSQTGFNASDEVIVVIDSGTVRVYSLTLLNTMNEVFTVMGQPLSFNDSADVYYQENGNILTDYPSIGYLENVIRVLAGDGALIVNEMFVIKGKVLCVVYDPTNITYKFYSFPINDFGTATLVSVVGGSIPVGSDFNPYFYCDGQTVYVTNTGGSTVNDYELELYSFDEFLNQLLYTSLVSLESGFIKTTNVVIKNTDLYSLIGGSFKKYSLTGGTVTDLGNYNGVIGNIFALNGNYYFTSGEVAKKWTL